MSISSSRLSRTQIPIRPRAAGRHAVTTADIGFRPPLEDDRWPAIAEILAALHAEHRCSVRIVDADCGTGALLLRAVRHARALGFTAIEGRGIDGAPALLAQARSAAAKLHDPAIGVTFEIADLVTALAEEEELPADILLWRDSPTRPDKDAVVRAVAAAGRHLIVNTLPASESWGAEA
jgi:SAM-dependent methyltransferase